MPEPSDLIRQLCLSGQREVRAYPLAPGTLQLRADESDDGATELTFEGHASVYEREYDIFGGPPYGWTEEVAAGAGTKTLQESPDVQLLINHDGLPLARTKSNTLALSEDEVGLHVRARLDREDPDVQRVAPKLRRGDLDEMSFAFRIIRQEWNEDYTHRRIVEYALQKGDVSIVNYGANPYTSGGLASRSIDELAAALAARGPDELRALHELLGRQLAAAGPPPEPVRRRLAARLLETL